MPISHSLPGTDELSNCMVIFIFCRPSIIASPRIPAPFSARVVGVSFFYFDSQSDWHEGQEEKSEKHRRKWSPWNDWNAWNYDWTIRWRFIGLSRIRELFFADVDSLYYLKFFFKAKIKCWDLLKFGVRSLQRGLRQWDGRRESSGKYHQTFHKLLSDGRKKSFQMAQRILSQISTSIVTARFQNKKKTALLYTSLAIVNS